MLRRLTTSKQLITRSNVCRITSLASSNVSRTSVLSNSTNTTTQSKRTFSYVSYADIDPRAPVNMGIVMVPQQHAYVVERLGKFHRILGAGLHFLIPIVDSISYVHNLKEVSIPVNAQTAITLDNVTITIDGILYMKIIDPYKASYGIHNVRYAMIQIAQTTMRSELGKLTLDKTFAERENLNHNIVKSINLASEPWGVECLRYELLDIKPPNNVKQAMELQAEAERKKRATILESEAHQQSEINIASAERKSVVLQAEGEAEAITKRAQATAHAIETVANAIRSSGGQEAIALRVAEQYIDAFSKLAKTNNTLILPSNVSDPSAFIATAMTVFQTVTKATNASAASANATTTTTSESSENQNMSQ